MRLVDPVTNREVTARAKAVVGRTGALLTAPLVFTPVAPHAQVADLSTVVSLTPPAGATAIRFQVTGANVRTTTTNAAAVALPAAAEGFQLQAGAAPVELFVEPTDTLNFIQEMAGAVLEYQWGVGV